MVDEQDLNVRVAVLETKFEAHATRSGEAFAKVDKLYETFIETNGSKKLLYALGAALIAAAGGAGAVVAKFLGLFAMSPK